MNKEGSIIFKEVQKFSQWRFWLIIVSLFLVTIGLYVYGMIKQLVFGEPWGNKPLSDTMLLISGSVAIAFSVFYIWLFYASELITELRTDGLYIRFFPFHFSFHRFPLEELKKYEVRIYSPVKEYGGWGIRYGGSRNKAYNVCGNRGVQLEFIDGKRILIGSQNPEELAKAIDFVLTKHHGKE